MKIEWNECVNAVHVTTGGCVSFFFATAFYNNAANIDIASCINRNNVYAIVDIKHKDNFETNICQPNCEEQNVLALGTCC